MKPPILAGKHDNHEVDDCEEEKEEKCIKAVEGRGGVKNRVMISGNRQNNLHGLPLEVLFFLGWSVRL